MSGHSITGTEYEVPDSMKCDECGEILYADEDWRLKPEYVPGTLSSDGNEYIHERCFPPGEGQ